MTAGLETQGRGSGNGKDKPEVDDEDSRDRRPNPGLNLVDLSQPQRDEKPSATDKPSTTSSNQGRDSKGEIPVSLVSQTGEPTLPKISLTGTLDSPAVKSGAGKSAPGKESSVKSRPGDTRSDEPKTFDVSAADKALAGKGTAGTTDGGKDKTSVGTHTSENKVSIGDLIQDLGHDNFDTRQAAHNEIEKRASPQVYDALSKAVAAEKSKKHPDLEIIDRATKLMEPMKDLKVNSALREADKVSASYQAGLAEIAKTGKLSDETKAAYKKEIERLDKQDSKLSKADYVDARFPLADKAYGQDVPAKERLAALDKLEKLTALSEIPPAQQARLDYANLLIKSGAKAEAQEFAKTNIKGDLSHDSYYALNRQLGQKSMYSDIGEAGAQMRHLRHETRRHGVTVGIEKEWNQLMPKLSRDDSHSGESYHQSGQVALATGLARSGQSHKAVGVVADMLDPDKLGDSKPHWNLPWNRMMESITGANKDPRYVGALDRLERKRGLVPTR